MNEAMKARVGKFRVAAIFIGFTTICWTTVMAFSLFRGDISYAITRLTNHPGIFDILGAACIISSPVVLILCVIPFLFPVNSTKRPAAARPDLSQVMIKCPTCSQPTDSLKQYILVQIMVFIGIAAWMRRVTYTACPTCMREILLKNIVSWNILTANLLWLLIILPYDLILLMTSGSKGHSRGVVDILSKAMTPNTTFNVSARERPLQK